jgi:hypothetical protein
MGDCCKSIMRDVDAGRRAMHRGNPARIAAVLQLGSRRISMETPAIWLWSEPTMNSALPTIRIASPNQQSTLSKYQKLFNNLIKKIDADRKRLVAWQTMIPLYRQKHASEFVPLTQTFNGLRAELVKLFDKATTERSLNKNDKKKLKNIICEIAAGLIAENDDEYLKQIYNKHSGGDIDAEIKEEKSAMKAMMEGILGIDLDDDIDFTSPESMMAHVGEKMQQKLEDEEQIRQNNQKKNVKRKKSAKTLAKEEKQQAEAQSISQSIRDVYRKLAVALHPDKEQDALERDRKTALMQRVNVAYNNKDLLQLLELQLEVEQIDQATINTITEDRLKHYNKILTEQSKDLQMEVAVISDLFRMRFTISPELSLSPEAAMRNLDSGIRSIKKDISDLKGDLRLFQDAKNLKEYLKHYKIPPKTSFEDEIFWSI